MTDALQIKEFDVSGGTPLWVSWFDHPRTSGQGKASPTVTVHLETLPQPFDLATSSPDDVRELFRWRWETDRPAWQVQVDAGLVPLLKLGSVFDGGRLVGRIPLERRSFRFSQTRTEVAVLPADAPGVAKRPKDFKGVWYVLSQSAYRRGKLFAKGRLLVLKDRQTGVTLQIPCPVVFATYYGGHSALAQALLRGPWDMERVRVVNPDHTFRTDRGSQIGLRAVIGNQFALDLHLLLFDSVGICATNAISGRMVAEPGRFPREGHTPSLLETGLPFDWIGDLRIKVEGFRPYGKAPEPFVGLRVIERSWPRPGVEIVVRRDNDGSLGEERAPGDGPRPYSGVRRHGLEDATGPIETDPLDDPAAGFTPMMFGDDAATWLDPPAIVRLAKAVSSTHSGARSAPQDDPRDRVSFGDSYGTAGEAPAVAAADALRRTVERFEAVTAMLERVRTSGAIASWKVVGPPSAKSAAVGRWNVWQLPLRIPNMVGISRWSRIRSRRSNPPSYRPLTALVLKVGVRGHSLLVAVIEPRPSLDPKGKDRTFRSVTCLPLAPLGECIEGLLRLAVEKEGVWPDASDAIWSCCGVGAAMAWKHSWIELPRSEGAQVLWLSPQPFLESVRAVLRDGPSPRADHPDQETG